MIAFIFSTLLLVQSGPNAATDDIRHIDEPLIAAHTSHFDIRNNRIDGAEALLSALGDAHFVALGELHNRVRLGELTSALLHFLEPNGFNHFAVETGPYSARKLQELIRSGRPEVSAFYTRYASRMYDLIPIPFFKGETDLDFLADADSLGFELWGLDQEFYFSYAFLVDELLRLGGASVTSEQQSLHRRLKRRLYWLDRRNQTAGLFGRNFERSCRVKDDEGFMTYLDSFTHSENTDIQQIHRAFQTTLKIYCMAERGQASEPVRINYFRENFNRNFDAALEVNPEPKVFMKMGSFHMGRQQSPINLYDIGHHVSELALSRNQSSVHIYYLNRFFEGRDVVGRRGWEGVEHFVSTGDRERWSVVDLRPLREQVSDGTLTGTPLEIRTIQNYDFIIVAPEDDWVKRHW